MGDLINFRDFGGLPTTDGGHIRPDLLYRSAQASELGVDAAERLLKLDFKLIADMRYVSEQISKPAIWPGSYRERLLAPVQIDDAVAPHLALLKVARDGPLAVRNGYLQYYSALPFDEEYRSFFQRYFARLTGLDGRILIYCTAGKDRTGALVALTLHALGATYAAIKADYLRTADDMRLRNVATHLRDELTREFGPPRAEAIVKKLLGVDADYLAEMFKSIEERSGSVEAYLDGIGLTERHRQSLRTRLVARD